MSNAQISVAMATYNGERFLREQLDSLASQTRVPDELVVTDDCSTDRTLEVLEQFARVAPFAVRIFKNDDRLGFSQNFMRAASLCEGTWIAFCDQDDLWFPEKLATVTETFECHPATLVILNDQIITDEKLNPSTRTKLQNIRAMGLDPYKSFMAGCCTTFHNTFLAAFLSVDKAVPVYDVCLNSVAESLGVRLIIDRPLQFYRRHGENSTNWIASSPNRPSALEALRFYGLRDATDGWRNELECLEDARQRLSAGAHVWDALNLADRTDAAILSLDPKIKALSGRIGLVSVPASTRPLAILRFLTSGQYSQFSGYRSALKDLWRSFFGDGEWRRRMEQ